MSTLFVVATPIGNLRDISGRAIEILKSVPLIAAEDTRVTRKLLSHIGSSVRTLSYNENSPPGRLHQLLDHLESDDLALVTDAGTPGVSDPGSELVNSAVEAGHTVTPVPGASAVTAALSISGFSSTAFTFAGFLPRKQSERKRTISDLTALTTIVVLLETPHRLRATLEDMAEICPARHLVVCRELTKLHEEVFRGTAADALDQFQKPRGEFVIVLQPPDPVQDDDSDEELAQAARDAISSGLSGKTAVEEVMAVTGAPRSRAYPAVLAAQADSRSDAEKKDNR